MPAPDLADIRAAAQRIAGKVQRTPFLQSMTLSALHGAALHLKFENLQYTASFKERGALNRLSALPPATKGVVAMSAGNHAQGVAYHARRLGLAATIVMPTGTPFVKIDNTERLGARVVLAGEGVDEAAAKAHALARDENLAFIHPFDDPLIVAGTGTIALEMLADVPDLDTLLVPIGGGGLISGIAIAAKALRPDIQVIGVQSALYPGVAARRAGLAMPKGGPTIADGIAVKLPGSITLPIIDRLVDEVLLVGEAAIEAAVLQFLEIEKTVVEGAAATGLAALMTWPERFADRRIGMVLSGGNIDSRLLSSVILRGLARSDRLVRLRVGVPDSPGSLALVANAIGEARGNVVDVVHQRAFSRLTARQTDIDFTIETRNGRHADAVAAALADAGLTVHRLTHDED